MTINTQMETWLGESVRFTVYLAILGLSGLLITGTVIFFVRASMTLLGMAG